MRTIAALAAEYGSGSLRLTAMQNVVITDIPSRRITAFVNAVRDAGLALGGSPSEYDRTHDVGESHEAPSLPR